MTCGFAHAEGDSTWFLEITFGGGAPRQPPESELAAEIADSLGIPVLYPYDGDPQWIMWLAAPGRRRTRASVSDIDDPDTSGIMLDGVQERLPGVPGNVPVLLLPEVIRHHSVELPNFTKLRSWCDARCDAGDEQCDEAISIACNVLWAWEDLSVRMERNWPPDGWYPVVLYRDSMEYRDEGHVLDLSALPQVARELFVDGLAKIDQSCLDNTRPCDRAELAVLLDIPAEELSRRQWWWHRVPAHPAWLPTEALPGMDRATWCGL